MQSRCLPLITAALLALAGPALAEGRPGPAHGPAFSGQCQDAKACPPAAMKGKAPPAAHAPRDFSKPQPKAGHDKAEIPHHRLNRSGKHQPPKKGLTVGERIRSDAMLLRNPGKQGLRKDQTYWQHGGALYRVDPRSGRVLEVIGRPR